MMKKDQGQAIAALMHTLRPDWDVTGCLSVLADLKHRDAHDVGMAAIRLCATPEAKSPGALRNQQGPQWTERVSAPEPMRPPRKTEDCPKHPGNWAGTCPGCAADSHVGDDSTYNPRREGAGPRAAHVRAALLEAKARTCACGVDRLACPEHRNPSTQETEEQSA